MEIPDWTVVVPVKGTADAKSRLGATPELASAIALDTVEAALAVRSVGSVIVVTSARARADFEQLGAVTVADPGRGLRAAVEAGVRAAGTRGVAVLLGDLPALQPAELETALVAAAEHPLAFVSDAEGTGSSLITAHRASDHRPAFGADSRLAHLAGGYVELTVSPHSGLRRDVDTPEQLASLADLGRLGSRTASALLAAPVDPAESVT